MNTPSACSHCGTSLSPGERFCTACGQPITAAGKPGLGLVIAVGGVLLAFLLGVVLVVAWTRLRPPVPPAADATATGSTASATSTVTGPTEAAGEPSVVDDNVVFVVPASKKPEANTATKPAAPPVAEYVLPRSAERRLRREEVVALSPEQRRLARNEIFARHGYRFESADLREYFGKKRWYQPNPGFSESSLTATEKANAELVRQVEAASR